MAQPAQLGGDFGAELETLAFELYFFQHRRAEGLVGGGFVGEPGAEKKVRGCRQDAVGEAVSLLMTGLIPAPLPRKREP